jgi:hypothetical protein
LAPQVFQGVVELREVEGPQLGRLAQREGDEEEDEQADDAHDDPRALALRRDGTPDPGELAARGLAARAQARDDDEGGDA